MTLEELEQLAESGFTAGPWEFNVMQINSSHEDFPTIAMVHRRDIHSSPEMTIANSKLIAASPSLLATAIAAKKREKELVEALREVVDWYDLQKRQFGIQNSNVINEKARALLKDIEQ